MVADETVFFMRRLGLGLRPDENPPGSIRDWAAAQLSEIPPLDFYGYTPGDDIRSLLADDADPLVDFEAACKVWEEYRKAQDHLDQAGGAMSTDDYDALANETVWTPYMDIPRWRDCLVKTLTAVNGPSPVFERFWWFWCNHFTVSTTEGEIKLFYGPHTRNIRNRMTGTFAEMLHDAILNPAMLVYLDNWLSTGPNSVDGKRDDGNLNENLARELFELHTMSPTGGYTQEDVVEAALALTGWQFYAGAATHGKRVDGATYGTYFHRYRHEPGSRTILGKTYKSKDKGASQAPELIADLAVHPKTLEYLSFKLARHFIADEPPAKAVEKIRAAWEASNGSMVAIHLAVVDAVLEYAPGTQKFTTPENWITQCFRVTGVPLSLTRPWNSDGEEFWITAIFKELGQPYDQCPQPNGYSDLTGDWISKEALDRRLRLALFFGRHIGSDRAKWIERYAALVAGSDSTLAQSVVGVSRGLSTPMLLISPQFLKC